ncbi:(2Fe-2S)-binding protein [Pseudomaricurvus alkylphenolicus]|uniref:2Fe-2S iron-sulfur cluster-binding protein n=1 Tax=Pseudomaricurvus alkylphenolicus TaxID=1306991 RepID=UPI0014247CF6|nr:2Fe-2S iron-sulfur cluster-binding protein [Pseudomaricurvus alkylphenolicus]NIB38514.1 (2Fe-2S)-binding protein [Pseudomaricurvus alkylphenolicus]
MPLVKFVEADGREYDIDIAEGDSVMQGAVDNMVEGILAECGGACSCATCHCYVDEAWQQKIAGADEMEEEMLDAVMDQRPNSRLSCQIQVTADMDGLVIRLPESQY